METNPPCSSPEEDPGEAPQASMEKTSKIILAFDMNQG
jgi:hypothetical protein